MIKVRLSRFGKRNAPFYRIVVTEKSRKREGEPVDILGFWDSKKNKLQINKTKLEEWKKKGAQINKSVEKLLKQ